MPAAAAATVTAAQVIGGGEDHQAVREIKITGLGFDRDWMIAMPGGDTGPAKAGLVAAVRGDLVEEGFGNFDLRAPAGAFIGRGGAKLAVIGLAA